MPIITLKYLRNIAIISLSLVLLIFLVLPGLLLADDHEKGERHSRRYDLRKEHYGDDDHRRRRLKKDDEGNEVTGQIAAWLFISANLTVAFSIIIKGASRFLPIGPQTAISMKRFNQLQKKHLMRFHYVLNPVALCIALLHFLLSSCRSTRLPEWGLVLVTMMVVFGIVLHFKISPKWMWRVVYRLHTASATYPALIVLLLVAHLILD